ncbi:MAG: helix-turn-helix domain-containing protein [Huintestinicola sp.]
MPEPSRNNNQPRRNPGQNSRPQSRPAPITNVAAAAVLGICIIIAGAVVSSSLNKLTAAVSEQTFSSSLNAPSDLNITSAADKTYFTETEAAEYLKISVDDIKAAITKGEIEEYVKTSSGYTISRDKLDKYFENRAYKTMTDNNSSES